MKKVAGIFAVVVFTVGLFASQLTDNSISISDYDTEISCGICSGEIDERGSTS